MKTGFKKLLGNRIYLELPEKKEESGIVLDEKTKESVEKELLIKMRKLKVVAIGSGISDTDLNIGDYVLIDPVVRDRSPIIPVTDEENLLLINYFDIIHIWE